IGRLRDGGLRPSAEIIDICLEAVDILKKFLYRQWTSDEEMQATVQALLARIHRMVSAEQEVVEAAAGPAATPAPVEDSHAHLMELELEEPPPVPLLADLLTTDFRKPEISDRAADKPAEKSLDKAEEELLRKEPSAMPQSKSVRIALERLDRMMN